MSTGPREILLDGKGGLLFNVGNYDQLSKKIIFYKENKKKLVKLINLSSYKLDRFNYDRCLKKYLNLIKNV